MRKSQIVSPPAAKAAADALPASKAGEPTWEIAAALYPRQGEWTEEEYFEIRERSDRRIEFVRGYLDFHDMTEWVHAVLCRWLFRWLDREAEAAGGGATFFSPVTVQLEPGELDREPDVFVLRPGVRFAGQRFPGADKVLLAIEVVSPSRPSVQRDRVTKRAEYAEAGIPEYWIVDRRHPEGPQVLVLTLPDGADEYAEAGVYSPGDAAASVALPGLICDVAALFSAAAGTEDHTAGA